MKSSLSSLGALAAMLLPCSAQLVINEVMQNPAAVSDGSGEWFEIYNPTGAPVDIDGWTISDDGSDSHTINNGGPLLVPAGGFLVLSNNSDFSTNGGVTVGYQYSGIFLSNGADELILSNTTPTEVDRIEWDGGPNWPDPTGSSMALLDPLSDNNVGSNWDADETNTYGDGDTGTPGSVNPSPAGALTVALDVTSISEDGLTVINGTVTAPAAVSGDVTVSVTLDLTDEAQTFDTTIFDTDTEGFFTITAVDDFWPDGDQTVTVTVSAPTYTDDSETFTVTDDDTGYLLLVNEVYYAVDASLTDANGDSVTDNTAPSDEEFIELVNVSGTTLDLSDVTIYDNFGGSGIHTFPFGTVLEPGCAILIFAGGDIPEGSTAAFGETEVQLGSGLYLDDDGTDFLQIVDTGGSISGIPEAELQFLALPDQTGSPTGGSYALQTDADATSGYALHSTIPATSGASYSPGTQLDGTTAFCDLTDQLTVSFNVADISEGAGVVASGGTVSIPAIAGSDVNVYITTSDDTELGSPTTVAPITIFQGDTSADFDLSAIDDLDTDGTISVTLTARASGYLNGGAAIDVTDDDTVPYTPPNLIITEIMHNPAGSEPETEWIEIYNADSVSVDLTGFLIDDEDTTNWGAIGGGTLDPGAFAVIYNSAAGLEADVRTDWGIPVDALVIGVVWGSLANGPSTTNEIVELQDAFGNVLDIVNFDDASPWPSDPNGISRALLSTAYNDTDNDDGANWVLSTDGTQPGSVSPGGTIFSTGDVGTPGFDGSSAPANDFAAWINGTFANTVTDFTSEGTNDNDGPNVLDAFFGTDPTVDDNNAITVSGAAGSTFTFRHKLAKAAVSDVSGAYKWSATLGSWIDDGVADSGSTVSFSAPVTVDGTDPDFDIVEVTATVSGTSLERLFVRIEVTGP